jgi:hypothetical protein
MKVFWTKEKPDTIETTRFQVIEVEAPRSHDITEDIRTSVQALAHQPGFEHLLARCRSMRAYLKKQLIESKHASMEEVQYLQAGIYWAGWLEQEMTRHQPTKPPAPAYDFEAQAFREAQALIEVVGDK